MIHSTSELANVTVLDLPDLTADRTDAKIVERCHKEHLVDPVKYCCLHGHLCSYCIQFRVRRFISSILVEMHK